MIRYKDTMMEGDGKDKTAYLCMTAHWCFKVVVGIGQWDAKVAWVIHRVDPSTMETADKDNAEADRSGSW